MLRSFYEEVKKSSQEAFQSRPRAWLMLTIQLASTIVKAFENDARVVWTTYSAFPMELLAAFDVVPFDFEVSCSVLAGADPSRCAEILSGAEARGYSSDLCSSFCLPLGCHFLGYLPKADVLLASSYNCDGRIKTNEILAQYYGKEAVTLDVPNELSKDSLAYVSAQLQSITRKLEDVSGHGLDFGRLRECVKLSNRARATCSQVAELGKVRPFPWDGSLLWFLSVIGAMFSGTAFQDQLYRKVIDECEQRIAEGRVAPEEFRVLWLAGWPIQPTNIRQVFRENRVSVVMAEGARVYWDEIDEEHPFEGMALRCLKNPYVGPTEQRLAGVLQLAEEYAIDGVVHFSTAACRQANGSCRLIKDSLARRDIPFLVVEGDMLDERKYSAERTRSLLESFVELMAAKK